MKRNVTINITFDDVVIQWADIVTALTQTPGVETAAAWDEGDLLTEPVPDGG